MGLSISWADWADWADPIFCEGRIRNELFIIAACKAHQKFMTILCNTGLEC